MKNKEEYISLYDYTGEATRETGKGRDVYNAAKKCGIQVIYKDLPEDRQRENYTRVATYPRSFLDEYFGVQTEPATMNPSNYRELELRIIALEQKIKQLDQQNTLNVTNNNEYDDDLPF